MISTVDTVVKQLCLASEAPSLLILEEWINNQKKILKTQRYKHLRLLELILKMKASMFQKTLQQLLKI